MQLTGNVFQQLQNITHQAGTKITLKCVVTDSGEFEVTEAQIHHAPSPGHIQALAHLTDATYRGRYYSFGDLQLDTRSPRGYDVSGFTAFSLGAAGYMAPTGSQSWKEFYEHHPSTNPTKASKHESRGLYYYPRSPQ